MKVSLTGTGALAGDTVQLYNGTGTGSQLGTSYTLLSGDITNGFANVQTGTLSNGTTYAITARVTDAGRQSERGVEQQLHGDRGHDGADGAVDHLGDGRRGTGDGDADQRRQRPTTPT